METLEYVLSIIFTTKDTVDLKFYVWIKMLILVTQWEWIKDNMIVIGLSICPLVHSFVAKDKRVLFSFLIKVSFLKNSLAACVFFTAQINV